MSQFQQRLPYSQLAPQTYQSMLALTDTVYAGLDRRLVDLVFLRVSQINGCAFCVDMHWHDLVKQGEDAQRLNSVVVWREVEFFNTCERAALMWADIYSGANGMHADNADAAFAELKQHFSDTEIAHLSFAIATMNAWNTMGISMRAQVKRRK